MAALRRPFLIIDRALDLDACARLCGAMAAAPHAVPPVTRKVGDQIEARVAPEVRDTKVAMLDRAHAQAVRTRLEELKPRLAEHFGFALKASQDPQFLIYEPGGHYKRHRDNSNAPSAPAYVARRKVSLVGFLNPSHPDALPGGYSGGELVLYPSTDADAGTTFEFAAPAQTGAAVAFAADLPHAVRPVTGGVRYTLVAWYE